ncbi:MAG: hypothetical protein ACKVQR_10095 [Aquabacterium sp.]
MKLSYITAAVAILASGFAQADVQRLAGASASSINVVKALRNLCTGNGGTYAVYKTAAATDALGNIVTATCTGAAFVDAVDEVRINVSGGSYGAVLSRNGNTGATPVPMISAASATCVNLGAGTGSLSFMAAGEMKNCGATGQNAELSDGGYLDVEGSIFRANGLSVPPEVDDSTDFVPSAFLQAFGVGVSNDLYRALQAYQTAKGLLPATCATTAVVAGVTQYTATGSALPECQPSIARASMAALVAAGNNFGKKGGANFLLGGSATLKNDLSPTQAIVPDVVLGTDFTYCRRPDTSGTQQAANVYFLHAPTGSGEVGGALGTAGNGVSGTVVIGANYKVTTNSSSGNVRTCLNAAGTAAGIISLENNPVGSSDTFRFVKLNGQYIADGVANAAQTGEAIAGRYDFVYETFKYCPGGTCVSVLDAIDNALAPGASTPGLFLKSESNFTRNGNSNRPVTVKP